MRDSDWSRANLLRSDWLGLLVAIMTTDVSDAHLPVCLYLGTLFRRVLPQPTHPR